MAAFDPSTFQSPALAYTAGAYNQVTSYGPQPIQLQSTANFGAQQGIKILAYGASGVGKTRLAKSAPSPVILSAEGGLLSLNKENLPYFEVRTIDDVERFYQYLYTGQDNWQFRTVMLDSISEIGEVCLKNAKMNAGKDPRRAYGALIEEMIPLVRKFRDLQGRNVIVTAKEEWQKEESTGSFKFYPSLPGSKLGPDLPYYFDEVFRILPYKDTNTGVVSPVFQTQGDHQSIAKDRSGALSFYEYADIGAVIAKITGVPTHVAV